MKELEDEAKRKFVRDNELPNIKEKGLMNIEF